MRNLTCEWTCGVVGSEVGVGDWGGGFGAHSLNLKPSDIAEIWYLQYIKG